MRERLAREPVFAVISGLAGAEWGPVHDFCEAQKLPCLFPNVDAPVSREGDFYSLYFSHGVLLEAGLIAGELQMAAVGTNVSLSLFTEFENFTEFKPTAQQSQVLGTLLDQVISWSEALAPLRHVTQSA